MTESQLSTLTDREAAAMQVWIDKRALYRATGHGLAARAVGLAIWLVWQAQRKVDTGPDTEPVPIERLPNVRATDSLAFLVRAINKLPDPHRQAMRMQVLAHRSADEIAAELGLPVAEAESLLGEAAVKLRSILSLSAERTKADK